MTKTYNKLGEIMYIGIIGRKNENKITFNQEIINIIYKYNCIPLGIIVTFVEDANKEFKKIKNLIDMCDGFILQGGSDYYDIDIMITKYLYDKNIPTLGICLGMQTMGMAFNGIMNNISNHKSLNKYVHSINLINNSKLQQIIKKNKILVNSRHKSYILKTDLDIAATYGRIEAIEDKNKIFFIGVQWHPESLNDKNSKLLFDSFFSSIKFKKI